MKHVMVIALTLAAQVAAAQPVGDEKAAEEYFNKGNATYNLGRFDDAVVWFMKAYEVWAQPEFLYNIAQSYRLGGNCKQALFFYKRFISVKEKDGQPLSRKKKNEINKFISDLTECADKTESTATAKPDTVVRPAADPSAKPTPPAPPPVQPTTPPTTAPTSPRATSSISMAATPPTTTPPSATSPPTTTRPRAAPGATTSSKSRVKLGDRDGDKEDHVELSAAKERPIVWARLTGGFAVISAGDLDVPIQPVFRITAGYPLSLSRITIDLGADLSYTPLPYEAMGTQERGTMLGVRAIVAARYSVASQVALRGELGLGIASLRGLVDGNPVTTSRQAGSFTLPNARFGVAADYAITPNVLATISPAFGYSPGASGMYAGSMTELDVVVGVGYVR